MPVTQLQPIRQPSVSRAMQNALAIRGAETQNLLAEKQLGTFDETQEYVRAQRGREEEKQEWARSIFEFESSQEPIKRMEAFDKILRMTLTYSTYPTHDEKMKNLQTITKGDFSTVPTAEQIQQKALNAGMMPEKYYEEVWKPDILKTWAQKSSEEIAKIRAEGKAPRAVKAYVDPEGNIKYLPNNVTPPEDYTPYSTGMDIEVGPEGTRIRTGVKRGGVDESGLQRGTVKKIEEKQFNTSEQLARVNSLWEGYQKEFLEIGPRWKAMGTEFQEKLKGTYLGDTIDAIFGKASPEDKAFLQKYTEWVTKAVNNANLYIKEITGAQMSNQEAGRIMKAVVDADGIVLFDSHTKFLGKMESIDKALRLTLARTQHYLKEGFTPEEIKGMSEEEGLKGHRLKIEAMEEIINKEGKELMAGGMSEQEAQDELARTYPSVFQVR